MYLANSSGNSHESLWLVVQSDQQCSAFELPPSGDKIVVFGASVDANVKLPGAAPIALLVERDTEGLWLTPGYPDPNLRVDGQPLAVRRRMYGRAVVESSGVRLVLQVRDTPPTVRGGSTRHDEASLSSTTVIPVASPEPAVAPPTCHLDEGGNKTEELNVYELRMALERHNAKPATKAQVSPPPVEPKVQPLEPKLPYHEVPAAVRDAAALLNPGRRPSGDTTSYDGVALRQLLTQQEPASSVLPLMTRVGVFAKQKPLHVLAGASFGSLFLVVFMVGAASLVPKETPPALASIVVAAPLAPTVAPAASSAGVSPAVVVDGATATTDAPIDPSVQVAVGHLFAGRSAEAEQAYRELAVRHPDNLSYATLAKVLGRRNSADCRSNVDSKKSCPKVKP